MKLAFDIDGTIADVITPLKQRIWRDWHIDIDSLGISRHDFFEQIVQPGYFEQFLDYFFGIIEHHWTGIEPYPDTELIYEFEPITFITARKSYLLPATRAWIDYNFPSLIYTLHQSRSTNKIKLLIELGFQGIIEDRLQTAHQVAEAGLICYLINRPWNQDRTVHPAVKRVASLKEIVYG